MTIKYVLTYKESLGTFEEMEFETLEEALNQVKLDHKDIMEASIFDSGDWVDWEIKMIAK